MNDLSRQSTSPTLPFWPFPSLFGPAAPQNLNQPINPGWSFGNFIVNEQNSTAPDSERDIVAT